MTTDSVTHHRKGTKRFLVFAQMSFLAGRWKFNEAVIPVTVETAISGCILEWPKMKTFRSSCSPIFRALLTPLEYKKNSDVRSYKKAVGIFQELMDE